MPLPSFSSSSYGQGVSARRRTVSLVAAILINLLLLFLLLRLAPPLEGRPDGQGETVTFNLAPDADKADRAPAKSVQQTRAARPRATTKPTPSPIPPPIVPPPPSALANLIPLTREDYAAADIAKLPAQEAGQGSAETGAGAGTSGDSAKVGSGPHGEPLYAAEWYREPTQAELNFYLPKTGVPEGAWAEIACRTAARFHVEDCVALGDSPVGSHLGRGILEAAWQFLVRPPRVGGKSLVGAWVRIRIDFTEKARR